MNSRNGTSVNGRLLRPDEEYQLEPEDEVDLHRQDIYFWNKCFYKIQEVCYN